MADRQPAYFYHPVIGALSPMTLDMYFKNPVSSPATPIILQSHHSELPTPRDVNVLPSGVAYSDHISTRVRKPMTLQRTAICAVTGDVLPLSQMIRFVVSPSGSVVPDLSNKLPGPFLWVTADKAIIQKAIWRNTFASHTRQNVQIPENIMEILEKGLLKQAMNTLSLAKRAGELLFGFTKAEEALRAEQVAVYVVAADAKDNGREKLERLANYQNLPVIDEWASPTLSAAIGEENVMHIVLAQGGLTQNLLELTTKLKAITRTKS